MRAVLALCAVILFAAGTTQAAPEKAKAAASAHKAKAAAAAAMDPKAMEEMMMKAAAPGPHHDRFKKLAGEWDAEVSWFMDPSQPPQQSKSHSVVSTLMDGRYSQEQTSGEMMGRPFLGLGITGYDNILKKYVSSWIDNSGTGIMTSQGVPDASGDIVNWTGESSDPMTGKMSKFRMVTHFVDDSHYTFTMHQKLPNGAEMKVMEINYTRQP